MIGPGKGRRLLLKKLGRNFILKLINRFLTSLRLVQLLQLIFVVVKNMCSTTCGTLSLVLGFFQRLTRRRTSQPPYVLLLHAHGENFVWLQEREYQPARPSRCIYLAVAFSPDHSPLLTPLVVGGVLSSAATVPSPGSPARHGGPEPQAYPLQRYHFCCCFNFVPLAMDVMYVHTLRPIDL
jgi:hypothetical protein